MSKAIGAALKTHLQGELLTTAYCWRIERKDGTELFFTDHDVDLEIDGDTYGAALGVLTTALDQDRALSPDNMEVVSFLTSAKMSEADIRAGLFDNATVDLFLVNYEDLSMGKLYLCQGWTLGKVEIRDNSFKAELRGKSDKLNRSIGDLYSPGCRAVFGDSDCGFDTEDSSVNEDGSVDSVTDQRVFSAALDSPAARLRYGKITWNTGNNAGLIEEIKSFDDSSSGAQIVELRQAMPYEIQVGDTFTATWGCDKKPATCDDVYDNILNFRGEPFVPVAGSIPVNHGDSSERHGWTR